MMITCKICGVEYDKAKRSIWCPHAAVAQTRRMVKAAEFSKVNRAKPKNESGPK